MDDNHPSGLHSAFIFWLYWIFLDREDSWFVLYTYLPKIYKNASIAGDSAVLSRVTQGGCVNILSLLFHLKN